MSNARDDNEIAWQLHTIGQQLGNGDYKIRQRTISTRDEEWEEYTIEYNRKRKDR